MITIYILDEELHTLHIQIDFVITVFCLIDYDLHRQPRIDVFHVLY